MKLKLKSGTCCWVYVTGNVEDNQEIVKVFLGDINHTQFEDNVKYRQVACFLIDEAVIDGKAIEEWEMKS